MRQGDACDREPLLAPSTLLAPSRGLGLQGCPDTFAIDEYIRRAMRCPAVSRTAGSAPRSASLFMSTAIWRRESATLLAVCMIMSSISFSPLCTPLSGSSRNNPIFVTSEPFTVMIFKSYRPLMSFLMAIRADLANAPTEPASLTSPCSSVITGSMVRPSTFSIGGWVILPVAGTTTAKLRPAIRLKVSKRVSRMFVSKT